MRFLICSSLMILLLSMTETGWAATQFKQALTEKKNIYLTDGVFIGGQASSGTSLLGIRRRYSEKAKIERIILDLGDREAKAQPKDMGYFQAVMDATHKRVILDLAQLKLTKVSEEKLREVFKKSPYVTSVDFTTDPEDQSGTVVLNLKRPMQLEVFAMLHVKKASRLVLDLKPTASPLKGHR